jgi:hypothetical protein
MITFFLTFKTARSVFCTNRKRNLAYGQNKEIVCSVFKKFYALNIISAKKLFLKEKRKRKLAMFTISNARSGNNLFLKRVVKTRVCCGPTRSGLEAHNGDGPVVFVRKIRPHNTYTRNAYSAFTPHVYTLHTYIILCAITV